MTIKEIIKTITQSSIETANTFATINTGNTSPRFIAVIADENYSGSTGFYFWDGSQYNVITATPLNQLPTIIQNKNYLSSTENAS